MKNGRMILIAAAVLATALFAGGPVSAQDKIIIDGSTTVGPIAKAFAEYYMQKNPGVNITVSESGSGNGAKSLVNGTCDVADMSRFMKAEEFKAAIEKGIYPVAHVVAIDGIAIIVHPSNPVSGLTVEQVRDIYTGKITNWKQVGGPNVRIVMISRDTNSGTYESFEELVMKNAKLANTAEYVGSNGAIRQRVQGTPEQVKDNVRSNIEALAGGGGFVFNTIHNILPDVSPQNIVAMFEAVDEYR